MSQHFSKNYQKLHPVTSIYSLLATPYSEEGWEVTGQADTPKIRGDPTSEE